ncbi:MAG: DEAD/DEAH box helicase [Acidimicrobiia bacterium]|nr:DEAD/DEAH box helicase [Acidimicrobiia bacterium]
MRVRCGRCGSAFEVVGPGLHKCSVCDVTNKVRTASPVERVNRSFGGADDPFASPGWPREMLQQAKLLLSMCSGLLNVPRTAERSARSAYEAELGRVVSERLKRIPVDALNEVSTDALGLGAIKSAGFRTVADVRDSSRSRLRLIRGVGSTTSDGAIRAAQQVEENARRTTRVRFDVDRRPATQAGLLLALAKLANARSYVEPMRARLEMLVQAIDANLEDAHLTEARPIRRFLAGPRRRAEARAAYDRLAALLRHPDTVSLVSEVTAVEKRIFSPVAGPQWVWDDFTARSIFYDGLLADVGGLGPDVDVSQGFLPQEIVKRIREFRLDTSLLKATLRGYQTFGAKFALVQKRIMLGDEMGLGKTIEALAVLCHLRSRHARDFLVVCPASVLANWEHEVRLHSRLGPIWRLHGPQRDRRHREWVRDGGVAITTFDTLRSLQPTATWIAAVVVDEAHYVKNPTALRTKAVLAWLDLAEHTLLMSGTPMENRVEEFHTLVNHIRPDLASRIPAADRIAGVEAFRRKVAPVYLRRNQTDVLDELPPRIETANWVTLDGPAAHVYRQAVASRNFMAMRRAAFLTPRPLDSPKLRRLVQIVEEAADNNRKVVVFSFFRDVIQRVHTAVGPRSVGSITGSLPAARRQELVERFTTTPGPAVLVNQIQAGGIGLNIQAASVVILAEPQWKPSTEEQAIARCHRMGQVRPVQVHRLLTENSVDEHMLRILARKSALFAQYVRPSKMKDAAPEATDTTDNDPKSAVSVIEHQRRIIEIERT